MQSRHAHLKVLQILASLLSSGESFTLQLFNSLDIKGMDSL